MRVARERASRGGASLTITIRLRQDDLARARTRSAETGMQYQTNLKMRLHQALDYEEMQAGGRKAYVWVSVLRMQTTRFPSAAADNGSVEPARREAYRTTREGHPAPCAQRERNGNRTFVKIASSGRSTRRGEAG